jgi:hypothetical protein
VFQQSANQTYAKFQQIVFQQIMFPQEAKAKSQKPKMVFQQNEFQEKFNGFASWPVLSL